MTTPTVTETVRNGKLVGQCVELGRYTISAGERVLYGQRIRGSQTTPPAAAAARYSSNADSKRTATPPSGRWSPTTSARPSTTTRSRCSARCSLSGVALGGIERLNGSGCRGGCRSKVSLWA